MFKSVVESSEARAALCILTAAVVGSVVMGLVANFH
jgi:hypothetical protein